MERLQKEINYYKTTRKKHFKPDGDFPLLVINEVFNFAYGMSFGNEGGHRNYRSGGTYKRKPGEIFADTFQGKLAEFAVYLYFKDKGIKLPYPDTKMYGLGKWDSGDFKFKGANYSIKSTKSFGQLLLLESSDWDENGLYIPEKENEESEYAAFLLVRLEPFASDLLKEKRALYNTSINKEELFNSFIHENFKYELTGVAMLEDFQEAIKNNFHLSKGSYLNRESNSTKLDASNYYIQAGDLRSINDLIEHLR